MRARLLATALALALSGAGALAETAPPPDAPAAAAPAQPTNALAGVQVLFAPQAAAMRFDGKVLTLTGVAPAITFFADRPNRLAGHLTPAQFADIWNATADSFKNDPPNAAVSVLGAPGGPAVVELTRLAAVTGDTMSFEVRVLDGTLPEQAGPVSLFIDPWIWTPGGYGPPPPPPLVPVRPLPPPPPYYPPRPVYPPAPYIGPYPAPAPGVHCHYNYYLNTPVCRGVW